VAKRQGPGGQTRGWRLSLTTALTGGLALAMALALGVVAYISLSTAEDNTDFLLRLSGQLAVGGFVDKIDSHTGAASDQTAALARLLGEDPELLERPERLSDLLRGALYSNPEITGIAVIQPDGEAVAWGRSGEGVGRLEDPGRLGGRFRAFVDEVFARAPAPLRTVTYQPVLEVPIASIGQAAMRGGEAVAVVAVAVSLIQLSDFLDEADETLDVTGFILYGRDQVLAHHALSDMKLELSPEHPLPSIRELPDPILQQIWGPGFPFEETFFEGTDIKGHAIEFGNQTYLFLYKEHRGFTVDSPVLVGFHLPATRLNSAYEQLIEAATYALVAALAAVALIFFAGQRIARPIRKLGDASQAVADLRLEDAPRLEPSTFREVDSANRAFNAMVAALKRFETYVPRRLVRRMMELEREGSAPGSEEREITVLFTDIVSFTSLAHGMPASKLAALLNDHFALLAGPIEEEDGTIDKYIGDSVMAFWGAPEAQPDHARRAIRALRDISRILAADNAARLARGEAPIRIRAGLHSGPVVVGDIGAPGRINYTAVGDTVNLAQRLEAAGKETGGAEEELTVTVSEKLVARAKLARKPIDGVRAERLGPRLLRGLSDEVVCYRLVFETG
jgi:class 3 adenylate cyclase